MLSGFVYTYLLKLIDVQTRDSTVGSLLIHITCQLSHALPFANTGKQNSLSFIQMYVKSKLDKDKLIFLHMDCRKLLLSITTFEPK